MIDRPRPGPRVNFLYGSGTLKVVDEYSGLTYIETSFESRKDLRKLLYLYKNSDAVITVMFDDPHDD